MSLREQPYLPLYVQDFLTDEKLAECSAQSTGVYIRLMCLLHKSETYGAVLLKQKDKQNESKVLDFACKFVRQMPYSVDVIFSALTELLEENVLSIDGDILFQKRMVKDGKLSDIRSNAGKKGGKQSQKSNSENFASDFAAPFASGFALAKSEANTENEIENENKYEDDTEIEEEVGNTKKTTPARRKKAFDHQSPAFLLAMYLSKQIKKRLPSTQPAGEEKLQSWADAIDKCNRLDGHPWDEIKLVLKFSQDDSFWQQNILSGAKFREKYMQLLAKMQQGGSKHARINSAFLTHDQELTPLARRAVEMALAESEDGAYEECTE